MGSTTSEVLTEPKSVSAILCVDLDGTLTRGDLLWECLVDLLKQNPMTIFRLPFWLLSGKAHLKTQLAMRSRIDVAHLPYRRDVLEYLRERRSAGCRLALVTASAQELAQQVAGFLGIFDFCFASSAHENLRGRAKAELLSQRFGEHGFEYLGDSPVDLPVWRACSAVHVVGPRRLAARAGRAGPLGRVFPVAKPAIRTWIAAVRGLHWLKNLLLFLPLLLAHRFDARSWLLTAIGFVCFGLCASGIYVLNDLLDLHSDRAHPWKHKRPFAAGDVSIPIGFLMAFVLLATALPGSLLAGRNFTLVVVGYSSLTVWYSAYLKRIVLLDVFVLSAFYSIRIWAGALITDVPLSHWMLAFSLFFFLSLSMAKRYSELMHAGDLIGQGRSGRGYIASDLTLLLNLGIASGFSAVVIFILYVHSPEVTVLYRHAGLLMLLAPALAYWLSRLWLKANRGELRDDPVVLAMRDRVSYVVAAFALIVLIASAARTY